MRNCRTMCIFHHQLSIRCRDAVLYDELLPTLEPGVVYNSVCCSKKADEWNRRSEKIGSRLRSSVTGMCSAHPSSIIILECSFALGTSAYIDIAKVHIYGLLRHSFLLNANRCGYSEE